MPSVNKTTLKSSDGQSFEVEEAVVAMFPTLMPPTLSNNLTGKILAKVIEYCKKQVDNAAADESNRRSLKDWEAEFVDVDVHTLYELCLAARLLQIEEFQGLVYRALALMIKDKNVEEIREIFKIKNDFTPEEEAEIRRQVAWAFN